MLSPDGFDIAWTQYQGVMVDELNRKTVGTVDENATAKNLLLKYSRRADEASLFNHASMAHNNAFFFNCLAPEPTAMPENLKALLQRDFSSIETLRSEFIETGSAMFGPGFVWLVLQFDRPRVFRILTTYIAGSPYAEAHFRRQSVDMSTQALPSYRSPPDISKHKDVQNTVGFYGIHSGAKTFAPGGFPLIPVLCVNTWEHVWIRDWGVGNKRTYLEKWWDAIDWNVVASIANMKDI
ncbi:MAG: hypothetical protein M1829_004314 [Trizodia sp. TS-e1964]|nr:MAG: hypothetical protein M1829_004314 [Trizodia sp. TS-e1964]